MRKLVMELGHFFGALARKAIPLLRAGVKMAAPHVKRAGKDIVRDLSGQVINKVTERFGSGLVMKKNKKCKTRPKTGRKRKNKIETTSKDIFTQ
jgi:hypothetical protein